MSAGSESDVILNASWKDRQVIPQLPVLPVILVSMVFHVAQGSLEARKKEAVTQAR